MAVSPSVPGSTCQQNAKVSGTVLVQGGRCQLQGRQLCSHREACVNLDARHDPCQQHVFKGVSLTGRLIGVMQQMLLEISEVYCLPLLDHAWPERLRAHLRQLWQGLYWTIMYIAVDRSIQYLQAVPAFCNTSTKGWPLSQL